MSVTNMILYVNIFFGTIVLIGYIATIIVNYKNKKLRLSILKYKQDKRTDRERNKIDVEKNKIARLNSENEQQRLQFDRYKLKQEMEMSTLKIESSDRQNINNVTIKQKEIDGNISVDIKNELIDTLDNAIAIIAEPYARNKYTNKYIPIERNNHDEIKVPSITEIEKDITFIVDSITKNIAPTLSKISYKYFDDDTFDMVVKNMCTMYYVSMIDKIREHKLNLAEEDNSKSGSQKLLFINGKISNSASISDNVRLALNKYNITNMRDLKSAKEYLSSVKDMTDEQRLLSNFDISNYK